MIIITIIEDKGQQANKHSSKHEYFKENGIELQQIPLPVGDYILLNDKVQDVINRKEKRGLDIKKMDLLGTYDISVDTKKDMGEIEGNITGKQHARFRDECILASNNGINLIVLIENEDGITCIDDVFCWVNPRLKIMKNSSEVIGFTRSGYPKYKKVQAYPRATKGEQLAKAMLTMQLKYGVEFQFCKRSEAGAKIIELLTK